MQNMLEFYEMQKLYKCFIPFIAFPSCDLIYITFGETKCAQNVVSEMCVFMIKVVFISLNKLLNNQVYCRPS